MEFDIQEHLVEMEGRIRADITAVGAQARLDSFDARTAAVAARAIADAATITNTELKGRVNSLEEKASWLGIGVGTLFLTALGFIWRVVTGKP